MPLDIFDQIAPDKPAAAPKPPVARDIFDQIAPDTPRRAAQQETPQQPQQPLRVQVAQPREYPDMAAPAPSFWDKITAPIREGQIGRALGLDTITEAAKQRDPGLQDQRLMRFQEALPHPDAPGVVHGVADFASGMTTPENALIMGATGGLGTIESAIGKAGLSKLVSLGFSAQMISDAIQSGPQFAKQVQAGDWAGASETMTRVALAAWMAKHGVKHAMTPEPARYVPPPPPEPQQYTLTGEPIRQPAAATVTGPAQFQYSSGKGSLEIGGRPATQEQMREHLGAAPAPVKLSDTVLQPDAANAVVNAFAQPVAAAATTASPEVAAATRILLEKRNRPDATTQQTAAAALGGQPVTEPQPGIPPVEPTATVETAAAPAGGEPSAGEATSQPAVSEPAAGSEGPAAAPGAPAGAEGAVLGETGPHGPIFRDFHHDAAGAIAKLRELNSGEAIGALHHPEVGDIDLIWGEAGDPKQNYDGGYGLAHVIAKHPDIVDDLQDTFTKLRVTRRTPNRINLEDDKHIAKVRLEWDNKAKQWLLTAFEKRNPPATGRTTDVPGSPEGGVGRQTPLPTGASPVHLPPESSSGAPAPSIPLPGDLRGAKPRYNYGQKAFTLDFESDVDKAVFIAAQKTPSKADARFVDFVAQQTGLAESAIRARGEVIKARIKVLAMDAEPGALTVPRQDGLWPAGAKTPEGAPTKPPEPPKPPATTAETQPQEPEVDPELAKLRDEIAHSPDLMGKGKLKKYADLHPALQARVDRLVEGIRRSERPPAEAPPPAQPAAVTEPPAAQPTGPQRGEPGWVGNIPTSEIQVDAPRFQFKRNVGQGGAGEELREVTTFDPEKAGIVSVWRDPANGKTYVVNGHHRVELAQRAGAPEMTVRYLNAENAQEARTKGALINIAEGRGEPTDAAKVIRDGNMTPEDVQRAGISMKGQVARQGVAIANLAQPIYDDVMSGDLSAARGAVIGESIANPQDQLAVYDLVKERERAGKRMTNDQIAELSRLANASPQRTETQESLFGTEQMTRSLLPERAEVSEYIRKQLGSERKLFGIVGTQGAAERLGEAGNVIQAEQNKARSETANQGLALYDKLSTVSGPIGTALDRAAERIADGEKPDVVKRETYRQVRSALTDEVERLAPGVREPDVRRPEGYGEERPHPDEPVRDQLDTQGTGGDDTGTAGAGVATGAGEGVAPTAEEHGLFDRATEEQSRADAKRGEERLLGDQLTAQVRSGLAARPANLKPAENRGLFEEQGPETGSLFDQPGEPEPVRPSLKTEPPPDVREAAARLKSAAKNIISDETGEQKPIEEWSTEDLRALATVSAHYIRAAAGDLHEFTRGMLDVFGEWIRPYLEHAYTLGKREVDAEQTAAPPAVEAIPPDSPRGNAPGDMYLGSGLGALEPLFREAKEEGDRLRARRNEALEAAKAAMATPGETRAGEAVRSYYTAERDLWAARAAQAIDLLKRRLLPKIEDREALGIMREFRHRQGELQAIIDGTHPILDGLDSPNPLFNKGKAEEVRKRLLPVMREAMRMMTNPKPNEKAADAIFTNIAEKSLREGQAGGWLGSRWQSDEYVPHLLNKTGEGQTALPASAEGKAQGKIGKFFGFALRRSDPYPTNLHAALNGLIPKTLDPAPAFTVHSDSFARARATHLLEAHLADNGLGVWGDGDHVPPGWVQLAKHSDEFKKQFVADDAATGEQRVGRMGLYVPEFIDKALSPITDPDYTAKIPGFAKLRTIQRGLKEAILGLSGFHLLTENFMAAADMGPSGLYRSLAKTDRYTPEFRMDERDLIAHGGTTSIQGSVMDAYRGLQPGTIPTRGEVIRGYIPAAKQAMQLADAITRTTFDNVQRRFKVVSFALHRDAFLRDNPNATPSQIAAAKRGIASYVNGVYGGLHWENMGIGRAALEVARAALLAPDWSGSNISLGKYAFDAKPSPAELTLGKQRLKGAVTKETAQARLSRAFWTKQLVGGIVATQMLSLMFSGKNSKRPFQVYLGKDKEGKDVYQNVFFRGSAGDLVNLATKMEEHGLLTGAGVFAGGKAAPLTKLGIHTVTGRDDLGRQIAPKGLNMVANTVRGVKSAVADVSPVPLTLRQVGGQFTDPTDKYLWSERMLSLFGPPAQHRKPGPPKVSQKSTWQQIVSGRP